MKKEYTNEDVCGFLARECQHDEALLKEFGMGIMSRSSDTDFWDSLSEHLDCFRVCDECGKPIIVDYVVDRCNTYCLDDCLQNHLTAEKLEELYDNGNGDTYWTSWHEDSITLKPL